MTQKIYSLFGRFFSNEEQNGLEQDPEIVNEQVPWKNLKLDVSNFEVESKCETSENPEDGWSPSAEAEKDSIKARRIN